MMLLQTLDFIFSTPWTFFGTLLLILAIGSGVPDGLISIKIHQRDDE